MYESLCPQEALKEALHGKNIGFLSYGQSGGGKTFSIFGNTKEADLMSKNRGIAPRAILDLLKIMAADCINCDIVISIFEIYVDEIRDLGTQYVEEQKKSILCYII